jgi:HAD superfamily hydrolase (TIGR01490 family)
MADKKLIVFDFDGTLTTKDSLIEFIAFYKSRTQMYLGFLFHLRSLVQFYLGHISNTQFKERILTHFFRGESLEAFSEKGTRFAREVLPGILRKQAVATIESYNSSGATNQLVIVTASMAHWIEPWARQYGIGVIGTKPQVRDGHLTGKIEGKNCYGPEKVARLQAHLSLKDFDTIIAYGDSRGDKELLELANVKYYRAL